MSKSVTISIAANSAITCTKLFGFLTTGSPTLFAETIHSATDVKERVQGQSCHCSEHWQIAAVS